MEFLSLFDLFDADVSEKPKKSKTTSASQKPKKEQPKPTSKQTTKPTKQQDKKTKTTTKQTTKPTKAEKNKEQPTKQKPKQDKKTTAVTDKPKQKQTKQVTAEQPKQQINSNATTKPYKPPKRDGWYLISETKPIECKPIELFTDGKEKCYGYLFSNGLVCNNPYDLSKAQSKFNGIYYRNTKCSHYEQCPDGFPNCENCKKNK